MRTAIDKTINKKNTIKHRLIAEFLFDISPELYKTCEEAATPLLEDEKWIPKIFSYILVHQNGQTRAENEHFYLAVFYRIYSPVHLYTPMITKLNPGIRDAISNCFGFNNSEMVNHFYVSVPSHYQNPRWAAQVNDLAFDIVENIKFEFKK